MSKRRGTRISCQRCLQSNTLMHWCTMHTEYISHYGIFGIYLMYVPPGRRHAGYTQAWKKLIFWPPFHLRWSPVSMSNNWQLSIKLSFIFWSPTKKENMFPALTCVGTSTYLKPRLENEQIAWFGFVHMCVIWYMGIEHLLYKLWQGVERVAESDFYWWHHSIHPQGERGPPLKTMIIGFIFLWEISRPWFLSFKICRDG